MNRIVASIAPLGLTLSKTVFQPGNEESAHSMFNKQLLSFRGGVRKIRDYLGIIPNRDIPIPKTFVTKNTHNSP